MSDFVPVGKKTDFPVNQTRGVIVNGVDVAIANCNGKFTAFDNSCTHAHAQLSDCDIEEGCEVACPLHGARFSVETGAVLALPASRPLRMHEVKLEGDEVLVKLNQ